MLVRMWCHNSANAMNAARKIFANKKTLNTNNTENLCHITISTRQTADTSIFTLILSSLLHVKQYSPQPHTKTKKNTTTRGYAKHMETVSVSCVFNSCIVTAPSSGSAVSLGTHLILTPCTVLAHAVMHIALAAVLTCTLAAVVGKCIAAR